MLLLLLLFALHIQNKKSKLKKYANGKCAISIFPPLLHLFARFVSHLSNVIAVLSLSFPLKQTEFECALWVIQSMCFFGHQHLHLQFLYFIKSFRASFALLLLLLLLLLSAFNVALFVSHFNLSRRFLFSFFTMLPFSHFDTGLWRVEQWKLQLSKLRSPFYLCVSHAC